MWQVAVLLHEPYKLQHEYFCRQVRPSFVEASVQRRATSSPAHHLLVNYQRAHIAIIKAQFTSKRLRDGMAVSFLHFLKMNLFPLCQS